MHPLPETIQALFSARLQWMEYHHYSKTTRKNERITLNKFERWCAKRGILHPQEVTLEVIEHYQRWIAHQKDKAGKAWSSSYHIQLLGSLQRCLHWAYEQGYLLNNPGLLIEMPRLPQQLPVDVLSVEEIEKVLQQPDLQDPLQLRDKVMLELLYATAIRLAEILALRVDEIDFDRALIWIRNAKANKERVIPVSQRALEWINRYERQVRFTLASPDERVLFLGRRGKPLSRLDRMRHYIFQATGREGSCHLIRHSVATIMIENGCEVRALQEFLGHEHVNTTQRYTHIRPTDLKIMIQKYHPSASQKK